MVIFPPRNSLIIYLSSIKNLQGTYVEGIKEEVVLSPGHALSFIAAGEGDALLIQLTVSTNKNLLVQMFFCLHHTTIYFLHIFRVAMLFNIIGMTLYFVRPAISIF